MKHPYKLTQKNMHERKLRTGNKVVKERERERVKNGKEGRKYGDNKQGKR